MKRIAVLLVLSSLVLAGCFFSLLPKTEPLEERVLEGKGKPKILLLELDGLISFRQESDRLDLTKRPSKVAFFREALRKAEEDPDLAGVIVRINSPGGTVSASDVIYHEIGSFKEKKKIPVYAYIMELGASGGYYVACAADRIVAGPTAVTGSIGVIALKFNVEGLLSKVGVSEETYKSGPKKDFGLPFRPSTPEEKKMLQGIIDGLYTRFLKVVSTNRQKVLTGPEVKTLADGRIMTAEEALAAKLIDQVAYLDGAIDQMKGELKIEQARVVTYARPQVFKSNIYSRYAEPPAPGPQAVNLISINAEDLSLLPGVRFMYLWNP
jgi:protease-4